MKSLLTAIIPVKNIATAQQQISQVENQADLLEIRLDYLAEPTLDALKTLTSATKLPYILTLRCKAQGGHFNGDENSRLTLIKTLLKAKPDYLDLEMEINNQYLTAIQSLSPKTKLIRSFHDFAETLQDLTTILQQMLHPAVSIYKIVTHAKSSLDALRMMSFVHQHSAQYTMVGHCMGEDGLFSRIAGPTIGNIFVYAAVDDQHQVVSHQANLQVLRDIYFLPKKNQDTKLFALIGDPIVYSLGHIFHNKRFIEYNLNALYIKIRLQENELASFFKLCKTLPFSGFSVTMPLKKAVLPYVHNQSGLAAVNTLAISDDTINSINTDGIGALDAIETTIKVKNKKILILGAGGAETAIAQIASQRGANISIANRTRENAEKIARDFPDEIIDFSTIVKSDFSLVINTLPTTVFTQESFIDWLCLILQQHPTVMDVNYNRAENVLLALCKEYQCEVIRGEDMFTNQAIAQFDYWQTTLKNN